MSEDVPLITSNEFSPELRDFVRLCLQVGGGGCVWGLLTVGVPLLTALAGQPPS